MKDKGREKSQENPDNLIEKIEKNTTVKQVSNALIAKVMQQLSKLKSDDQ